MMIIALNFHSIYDGVFLVYISSIYMIYKESVYVNFKN